MFAERRRSRGADVGALIEGLEALQDRGVSRLRQKAEQLAVALEEAAQGAGDGKGPVAVRDGSENLGRELFGKQEGALGLATGTEIPREA
jgi:hypothetical protein